MHKPWAHTQILHDHTRTQIMYQGIHVKPWTRIQVMDTHTLYNAQKHRNTQYTNIQIMTTQAKKLTLSSPLGTGLRIWDTSSFSLSSMILMASLTLAAWNCFVKNMKLIYNIPSCSPKNPAHKTRNSKGIRLAKGFNEIQRTERDENPKSGKCLQQE